MSTATRLLSGTAASWLKIGVSLLTQLALVPLYLTYWNVQTFGVWVAVQAFVNMFIILDRGHVDYLGFEFLKAGAANKQKIGQLLWSGILMVAFLAFVELFVVLFLSFSLPAWWINDIFVNGRSLVADAGWTLFFLWLGWTVLNSAGLFFRALTAFGYYPRMQWWSVAVSVTITVVSVIVIVAGGGMVTTALWICISQLVLTGIQYMDIMGILKSVNIPRTNADFRMGLRNFSISVMLSLKYFLENFRQQGSRVLLAPLLGVTGLAAFSAMRTASNSLLQGLSTISNPVLPELMRFLNERDQQKSEGALGTVWLLLVAVLSPAAVVFQVFAGSLFAVWTRGDVLFDPFLFGFLSSGVLIYALSQPAMAILTGNNLLRSQIILSAISFVVLIIALVLLIPVFGLTGAGIALMVSELMMAFGFIRYASKWLLMNQLRWPANAANIAGLSVLISFVGIMAINFMPSYRWLVLAIIMILLAGNAFRYIHTMPAIVWVKTRVLINKFRAL